MDSKEAIIDIFQPTVSQTVSFFTNEVDPNYQNLIGTGVSNKYNTLTMIIKKSETNHNAFLL